MQTDKCLLDDINQIAAWLAADELPLTTDFDADLIVLAGHAVVPAVLGVMALAAHSGVPLLLTGGVGHSTALLKQAVRENAATRSLSVDDLTSEAAIFQAIATRLFAIPLSQIYLEDRSANCGQNADFSRDLILNRGLKANRILLSQDPLMQRRTRETFAFSWRQKQLQAEFINCPVFVPRLLSLAGRVSITGAQGAGIWDTERFIAMALGEMRRLHDNADGYGPAGAGFIGHVAIPTEVQEAWHRLRQEKSLAGLSRA